MRPLIAIFLLSWLFNLFLPWWSVLIPSILIGAWLLKSGLSAFITGLSGGGLAWFVQALYIHIANDGILAGRIAELFQVGSPAVVLILTFLTGGILSGFGALLGYQVRAAFGAKKLLSNDGFKPNDRINP